MRDLQARYIGWFHDYDEIRTLLLSELDVSRMNQGFHAFRANELIKGTQDIVASIEIMSSKDMISMEETVNGWLSYGRRDNPLIHIALKTSVRHMLCRGFDPKQFENIHELVSFELNHCIVQWVDYEYVDQVSRMEKPGHLGSYFYGYESCRNKRLRFERFIFKPEFNNMFLRMFFDFGGYIDFEGVTLHQRLRNALEQRDDLHASVILCFMKSRKVDIKDFEILLRDASKRNFLVLLSSNSAWMTR